jgi:hypothetical protein
MGMVSKELMEGMEVNVSAPEEGDSHPGPFVGLVAGIQEDTILVKDQDGNVFEMGKARVKPISED